MNRNSKRLAFVLYLSNTSNDMVVRFDDFTYNSLVRADESVYAILPDEPFRTTQEDDSNG